MENLSFVGPTSWREVLSDWRARETGWGWEEFWKGRGFESWEAWRATYFESFRLPERQWKLHFLEDPAGLIPQMWAVAYTGWKQYYPTGASRARLSEIAQHPTLPMNEKIIGLRLSFPSPTTVIGIRFGNDLAIFEGLHRCATIALAAERGAEAAGTLFMALTDFGADESELFEKAITQKS